MKSRTYFVFVVFCFSALLILTIYLRNAENRIFYELVTVNIEQDRLKQQLWQKQLRLESLINPAAVTERISNQQNESLGE